MSIWSFTKVSYFKLLHRRVIYQWEEDLACWHQTYLSSKMMMKTKVNCIYNDDRYYVVRQLLRGKHQDLWPLIVKPTKTLATNHCIGNQSVQEIQEIEMKYNLMPLDATI